MEVYLVKDTDNNHWKCSEENIIQRLKPIVVKPLAGKARVECEPELGESEGQILVEEIRNYLLQAIPK